MVEFEENDGLILRSLLLVIREAVPLLNSMPPALKSRTFNPASTCALKITLPPLLNTTRPTFASAPELSSRASINVRVEDRLVLSLPIASPLLLSPTPLSIALSRRRVPATIAEFPPVSGFMFSTSTLLEPL